VVLLDLLSAELPGAAGAVALDRRRLLLPRQVRAHLAKAIDDENAAARLLHDQLTAELKTLDSKEETCSTWQPTRRYPRPRSNHGCETSSDGAST
jgi:hypothetical protein